MLVLCICEGELETGGQWSTPGSHVLAERGRLSPRQVCDPTLEAEPHSETDTFVDAIEGRLRCSGS